MTIAPAAPPAASLLPRLPAPNWRAIVRDMLAAAALVCLATVVAYAEAALQDWIPEVVELPTDAAVVTDREIGSTVRMFSVTTGEETGPLLEGWAEALRTNGYDIERDTDELLEQAIQFSGPGIANAKIVATRSAEGGQTLIEFDATLD